MATGSLYIAYEGDQIFVTFMPEGGETREVKVEELRELLPVDTWRTLKDALVFGNIRIPEPVPLPEGWSEVPVTC